MTKKKTMAQEDLISESDDNTIDFILKFFKAKSLNIDKVNNQVVIKGILDNSIDSFSFLNDNEAKFIKKSLEASKLGDLIQYKDKNIYNYISFDQLKNSEKEGIEIKELEEKIIKAVNISTI